MTIKKSYLLSLIIALVLLAPVASPVRAVTYQHRVSADAALADAALPPLPEWPIIGPILRVLGISAEEPEPAAMPTPDPNLPEYRITSFEDMEAIDEIEPNERVRVIATAADLNQMILELLREADMAEAASLTLDFEPNLMSVDLKASSTFLDQMDLPIEIPALLRGRNINAAATMNIEAVNCRVNLSFEKVELNNWSLGLQPLANRTINERIPDLWPSDLCVEAVYLMSGEAAVEGYRR
jgi:hypothetical protein